MDYQQFYDEMNQHYYRANCYHTMRDPDNDATSGNHNVLNATYHLISSKLGGYEDPVQLSRDFVKELRFVQSIEKESGLYYRHPNKKDQPQTHDDYIGLVVSSKLLPPLWTAKKIVDYGKSHYMNWYYDPLGGDFKFDSWHGRFPGLSGAYKRAAGESISWLDRIGFCTVTLFSAYFPGSPSSTSGKILSWLENSVMKGESKSVDYCINKWEEMIKKQYPTGYMGEVMSVYHGYEHPFSQSMWRKL